MFFIDSKIKAIISLILVLLIYVTLVAFCIYVKNKNTEVQTRPSNPLKELRNELQN